MSRSSNLRCRPRSRSIESATTRTVRWHEPPLRTRPLVDIGRLMDFSPSWKRFDYADPSGALTPD